MRSIGMQPSEKQHPEVQTPGTLSHEAGQECGLLLAPGQGGICPGNGVKQRLRLEINDLHAGPLIILHFACGLPQSSRVRVQVRSACVGRGPEEGPALSESPVQSAPHQPALECVWVQVTDLEHVPRCIRSSLTPESRRSGRGPSFPSSWAAPSEVNRARARPAGIARRPGGREGDRHVCGHREGLPEEAMPGPKGQEQDSLGCVRGQVGADPPGRGAEAWPPPWGGSWWGAGRGRSETGSPPHASPRRPHPTGRLRLVQSWRVPRRPAPRNILLRPGLSTAPDRGPGASAGQGGWTEMISPGLGQPEARLCGTPPHNRGCPPRARGPGHRADWVPAIHCQRPGCSRRAHGGLVTCACNRWGHLPGGRQEGRTLTWAGAQAHGSSRTRRGPGRRGRGAGP